MEDIGSALEIPANHKKMVAGLPVWIGMDVGLTQHPSEILVYVELPPKARGDESTLKLLARYHLQRISAWDQVTAIIHLIKFYEPVAFAMDSTGLGLPLFQILQKRAPELLDQVKGYNFSAKVLVDFDERIEVEPIHGDLIKEAGIEKNVLEQSTDVLRGLVDSRRLLHPYDREVLKEFSGQTMQSIKTGMDQYGRTRRFSQGTFHALDAARMAALAHSQHAIDEFIKVKPRGDVNPVFF
jgi:hypothetical protein